MKNILFRGKALTNSLYFCKNDWIYGDFLHYEHASIITPSIIYYLDGEEHIISVDSVGQYTGVDDKNGKKLFEGDVVRFITEDRIEVHALCVYDEDFIRFAFETKFSYYTFSDIISSYDQGLEEKFEIIGNVFDNPELVNWEVDFIENK